jgi:DNA-binding LacI/PurR family transcriptional regulator
MCDLGIPLPACTRINVNDATGVRTMVSYLRSLGHRRFGVRSPHEDREPEGPLRAHREGSAGRRARRQHRVGGGRGLAGRGRLGSRTLLAAEPRPTAIISLNDHVAIGVLRGIREHGLCVPEDVSVVGFDNIGLSEYTNPSLTTVHVPRDCLGRLAMERILDVGRAAPNVIVDPQLLIRESTGQAPPVRRSGPERAGSEP